MRLEKHRKQRMHVLMSSRCPVRALFGKSGSAMRPRAILTISALPEAIISSISSGSESAPTVATFDRRICGFIIAAYFTIAPSSWNIDGWVTVNASTASTIDAEPAETCRISGYPSSAEARRIPSSMSYPPGVPSMPLNRNSITKSGPTARLMALQISRGRRTLFSMLPPHRSFRLLNRGDMNCVISHPCPPWTVTIPKPTDCAHFAARAKLSIVSSIISSVMGRTCMPFISHSEGP